MGGPKVRSFFSLAVAKYPEEDRYRCLSCGFLAEATEDNQDLEIRSGDREMGLHFADGRPVRPFCFQNAENIYGEYAALLAAKIPEPEAAKQVIWAERKCVEWYPYSAGASPLWHREEMRMMHLEELRTQNDLALARMQERSDERGREIAESLRATAEATGTFTTRWTYIAVLLAFLAVVGVFLAWLYPNPFARPVVNPPTISTPTSPAP